MIMIWTNRISKTKTQKNPPVMLFEKFYHWQLVLLTERFRMQIMNFDRKWTLCLIIAYSFLDNSYCEVGNRNKRFCKKIYSIHLLSYLGCFTDEEQSRALANVPTDRATIKNLSISSSLNRFIHPRFVLPVLENN